MTIYKCSISECDIDDKESAELFRSKRAQWIEWLTGKDPHSIWGQINSMLWDYLLFCTINELPKIAAESSGSDVGFNAAVLRLFDAGFATTQATAIRRLTEKPKPSRKLAVISLRRVLQDIEENRHLITRENYVAYDGLPYDPEVNGQKTCPSSERAHRYFDKLSEIQPSQRQRTDLIKIDWFEYLEEKLKVCDDVRKYVDKFIAHAADPKTREKLTDTQKGITLERLESCHKSIYQVAAFIYGPLLWEGSYGGLPVPQYDHLANLDKRWISTEHRKKAYDVWDQLADKVRQWESKSLWPSDSRKW